MAGLEQNNQLQQESGYGTCSTSLKRQDYQESASIQDIDESKPLIEKEKFTNPQVITSFLFLFFFC